MITAQSPKDQILGYQRKLQSAGLYLGPLDGIWGPITERADQAYQAAGVQLTDPQYHPAELQRIEGLIVAAAESFLNLTETAPNARWDDVAAGASRTGLTPDPRGEELRQALLATGWQLGWAYCIAFAEVCWRAGYKGRPELPLISTSITPSVMGTYGNFQQMGRVSRTPVVGAIMLMQHGDSWQGHSGIVTGPVNDGSFPTIEGNTSSNTNSREGDGVYRKSHSLDFTQRSTGLWLRGFVDPFLI